MMPGRGLVGRHPGAIADAPGGKRPLVRRGGQRVSLDPVNYGSNFQSDAQGRLTLPALIPGATYRVEDFTPAFGGGDPAIRKEFTVRPGETIDLGDIVIARPQAQEFIMSRAGAHDLVIVRPRPG